MSDHETITRIASDIAEMKHILTGGATPEKGYVYRTAQLEHSMGNVKLSLANIPPLIERLEVVERRTVAWEKRDDKADEKKTWRNRMLITLVAGTCITTVGAQAAMILKTFSDHEEKASEK